MRFSLLSILLSLLASDSLCAQEGLAPAERIQSGDEPIDVEGYRWARPFLGDFNGDGLNDLLVGQDDGGRLRIYRNRGSNEQPRFDGYELLRVNGEIAELPCGGEFSPQLIDFDGDGKLDILSSSGPGYIFWYRRRDDASFDDPEMLKLANGQALLVGTYGACHATDWDGDGDTDLILMGKRSRDAEGSDVEFVENTGSPRNVSLTPPVPMKADDVVIRVRQIFSYPFVADWNGDGHQDLLIGLSNGSVMLYENRGEGSIPTLTQPRELVPSPLRGNRAEENDIVQRGQGGSLCVVDWDNDGRLDILIGDEQSEMIQPKLTDEQDRLETARREAAQVLREYRRMRRLSRKLDESAQATQKEFVQKSREKFAQRLKLLNADIAAIEQAMQPEFARHSYIWLLRRNTPR